RLDALAAEKAWAPEAIDAMAHYVATGAQFAAAASALTYVTAFPFLQSSQRGAYDALPFGKAFRLTRRIARANSLLSPLGMLIRLTGGDRRAHRTLRKLTGGNDYGLHALTVSIDNSLMILENLKQFARESRGRERSPTHLLRWLSARTAPALVLRQVKERFFL